MRFLLDNDVDVAVGRVLRSAGHECWTAAETNLAGRIAADTFGKHVWLRCEQPDAAVLVSDHLDELETALTEHPELVVIVSTDGTEARPPSWE